MAHPGGPPAPARLPADCPKDAAYIRTVGKGGHWTLPNNGAFPIVFEGGDGNDSVTVIGRDGKGVLVYGGRGDDRLTVQARWSYTLDRVGPPVALLLAGLAIVLAAVATIAWRALSPRG